jgi:hypothetical protein
VKYTEQRPRAVFDVECTSDYFLICFIDVATGRRKHFEMYEGHPLDRQGVIRILRNFCVVGFNSLNYDMPMVKAALKLGATNLMLKKVNDAIINRRMKYWQVEKEFNLPEIPWLDHIDLIEPAPSVMVSLKLYGARLHSKRLQDMPFDPAAKIIDGNPDTRLQTIDYCFNDCETTIDLYKHIEPQLNLRCQMSDQYGLDLRSKSDAQIAEAVIRSELERIKGEKLYKPELPHDYSFQYQVPHFIRFKTQQLREVLHTVRNATFSLSKKRVADEDADENAITVGGQKVKISGIAMPKEIKALKITIGSSTYKMGIGGLHSTEKAVSHHATKRVMLRDADVNSYYPACIINCELYPDQLGFDFLSVYRGIRDSRLDAKKKAEGLKQRIKELKKKLAEMNDE